MGGGQNPRKINPLFKDVKEYNKYLLSLIGIFVLLLTGIISYNYTNTSYAKWSSSIESKNILKISAKKKDYALKFAEDNVGTGGLEEVIHEIDDTLQVDKRFATEYRYRGGDSVVNNYVTFNNEVWRIIGIIPTEDTDGNVENRFKIIKNESVADNGIKGTYWNENHTNNWTEATLNTYLNNDYYNTLTTDAKNMIGTTKYYLGGYSESNITSDVMWQYERKNEANRTGYYYGTNPIMQTDASKKIAIMYASDYGYATLKECTVDFNNYIGSTSCKPPNVWLWLHYTMWLLTPESDNGMRAFYLSNYGPGCYYDVNYDSPKVYPVLSLSSNVRISGGTGTSSDPYQLIM